MGFKHRGFIPTPNLDQNYKAWPKYSLIIDKVIYSKKLSEIEFYFM